MKLLLLLFQFIASAHANDVDSCRRLLANVVEKTAMTADALRDFANRPDGTNPAAFADFTNETTRHVYSEAFEKMLKSPEVAEVLRVEARRLADEQSRRDTNRAAARVETVSIPAPATKRPFEHKIETPVFSIREGRKIATFISNGNEIAELDLQDGTMRVIPTHGEKLAGNPQRFVHDGEEYFAVRGESGLRTVNVNGRTAKLFPEMNGAKAWADAVPLLIDGKSWMAYVTQGDQLVIEPAVPGTGTVRRVPRFFSHGRIEAVRDPGASLLIGTKRSHQTRLLYDVARDHVTPFPARDGSEFLFFFLQGGALRLFEIDGPHTAILNAAGKRVHEQKFSMAMHPSLHEGIDSTTEAFFSNYRGGRHQLTLFNLDHGRVREVGPLRDPKLVTKAKTYFKFRGREFAAWGSTDGTVAVADFTIDPTPVSRQLANDPIASITPYETPTGVDAILRTVKGAGAIIQLIGPPVPQRK